jgi:hypothetical protein
MVLMKNFTPAAIEGALVMAGDSVDLDVIWGMAVESGVDVLPAGPAVRRAAGAILKKRWRSFGYDYVLAAIHAKHEVVLVCDFCFGLVVLTLLLLSLGPTKGKRGNRGYTRQNYFWSQPWRSGWR